MESIPEIVKRKNDWLISQVDVQYPTKESLKGRDLYLEGEKDKRYALFQSKALLSEPVSPAVDELYLIDFHRLTVMFSLLQASRWAEEQEKAYVLEFFSQIILSSECQLYLGFTDTNPVACAIVMQHGDDVLISDVVTDMSDDNPDDVPSARQRFTRQLFDFLGQDIAEKTVWVEE
jgi:hypothetical protein